MRFLYCCVEIVVNIYFYYFAAFTQRRKFNKQPVKTCRAGMAACFWLLHTQENVFLTKYLLRQLALAISPKWWNFIAFFASHGHENTMWSELGKQNKQAKKVLSIDNSNRKSMETWKSNGFHKQSDNSTHSSRLLEYIIILATSAHPWGKILWNNQRRTGNGKPWKSWNLRISFPKPGNSWNLIIGVWKSSKIKVSFGRLVTADDKARTM